jgi:hypothetical protein
MTKRSRTPLSRRVRRFLFAATVVQLAVRAGGRLAARRLDVGEESSPRIRRVRTMGPLVLKPGAQDLARIELDLVMAGAQLDLTGARPAPGGLDLILTLAMSGAEVRLPRQWRVSWVQRGPGAVTVQGSLTEAEPAAADLRIDVRTLAGGATLRVE